MQAQVLPPKEFDMWEASAIKTYQALKTFFHEAYGQCLTAMALRSTSGQNGYATQNIYSVLEGDNNTNRDTVTTTTQTATATTITGTTPHVGLAINADITSAITVGREPNGHHVADGGNIICTGPGSTYLPVCAGQHVPSATHPAGGHTHAATLCGR